MSEHDGPPMGVDLYTSDGKLRSGSELGAAMVQHLVGLPAGERLDWARRWWPFPPAVATPPRFAPYWRLNARGLELVIVGHPVAEVWAEAPDICFVRGLNAWLEESLDSVGCEAFGFEAVIEWGEARGIEVPLPTPETIWPAKSPQNKGGQ